MKRAAGFKSREAAEGPARPQTKAALGLTLSAMFFAELLTGSSPPLALFNPILFGLLFVVQRRLRQRAAKAAAAAPAATPP